MVVSTSACADYASAIAASRAGALGVADLTFTTESAAVPARLERVAQLSRGRWGIQTDDSRRLSAILAADLDGLETVLVSAFQPAALAALVTQVVAAGRRAYAVA